MLAASLQAPQSKTFCEASRDGVVDPLKFLEKTVNVVRDDRLPGGTKQRGLYGLLVEHRAAGVHRFVYASPFCGYVQVALSYLCAEIGLSCVLFCERNVVGVNPYAAHGRVTVSVFPKAVVPMT